MKDKQGKQIPVQLKSPVEGFSDKDFQDMLFNAAKDCGATCVEMPDGTVRDL